MGGTSWSYKVDYDDDPGAALARLRDDVFASGAYEKPNVPLPGLPLDVIAEEVAEEAAMQGTPLDDDSIARFAAGADPISIDEALTWAMESGTHSILDLVGGVASAPTFGVAAPVSGDDLVALFGTDRPSEAQVEARLDALDELAGGRWQAVYLAGFTDDQPTALYFVGSSGD